MMHVKCVDRVLGKLTAQSGMSPHELYLAAVVTWKRRQRRSNRNDACVAEAIVAR